MQAEGSTKKIRLAAVIGQKKLLKSIEKYPIKRKKTASRKNMSVFAELSVKKRSTMIANPSLNIDESTMIANPSLNIDACLPDECDQTKEIDKIIIPIDVDQQLFDAMLADLSHHF